jgi:hypothetical protein
MEGDLNSVSSYDIEDFVKDCKNKKIEPFLKSEIIKRDKGPLKKIVGKNF